MTRRCSMTGKRAQVGCIVSHANNRAIRRFQPNLQAVSLFSDALGATVRLRLSVNGIRTVEKRGGLDAYLLSARASDLDETALKLKRRIKKAAGKAKAA
ncbi:MAG: 50S ribosomal protein L28 [Alphaproteobacteria bacterium]|nr:50S ribosomal protein L28 [Alphaproteobacteria bacterium]